MSVKNARRTSTSGRQQNIAYYQTYVDGNTVRKLDVMPEQPRRNQPQHDVSRRKNQARQAAVHVNIISALFLTAIMGLLLWGCVNYLQIQASVTSSMKHINAMESQLSSLRAENDAEYNRVIATENLEEIRRVAIEELGMVYASADQVVLYESNDTDFVRQYQDVPETAGEVEIQVKAASIFGR